MASDDEYIPRSWGSSEAESGEEEATDQEATEQEETGDEEAQCAEGDAQSEEGEDSAGAEEENAVEEDEEDEVNPNMQLGVVNWKYQREALIGVYQKLQLTMHMNMFEVVKSKLQASGQEAIRAFRRSAFGMYWKYSNRISQSQRCLSYLVARQVVGEPDPDPNALWFKIDDQIVRFSRKEFALITGLKFGASEFNPYADNIIPPKSLYTRRFKNKKMTTNWLWNLFSSDGFDVGNAEDCVKLCKVLIAAAVVLGNNPFMWKIPDWIWVLVEDTVQWDNFPWGSMSYQILVNRVSNVKKSLHGKMYHLHCNTLAFLGWIFNAIPELGEHIGGLRSDFVEGEPRGLAYTYHTSYAPIEITRVHGVLTPTELELKTDYWQSLEPDGTFFSFVYEHDFEQNKSRSTSSRPIGEDDSEEAGPSNRGTGHAKPSHGFTGLLELGVEAEVREAAAVLAFGRGSASRDGESEPRVAEKRDRDLDELSDLVVKKLKAELFSEEFVKKFGDYLVDMGRVSGEQPVPRAGNSDEQMDEQRAENRDEERAEQGNEPTPNDLQTATAEENVFGAVLRSPFRPTEERGTNFLLFMLGDDDEMRNVGLPYPVGKDYFKHILAEGEMMENQHMDTYVSILAKYPTLAKIKKDVNRRVIPISMYFMMSVEETWQKMVSKKPWGWKPHADVEVVVPLEDLDHLARYAEGLLPEWGGLKKWKDADKLVLLCNLAEHWVVVEVDLISCTMIMWDSNEHKYNDHLIDLRVQALRPVGVILPQLLRHIQYYAHNPGEVKFTEWALSFPPKGVNKLQQNDSVSCGPLALKSMENRLTNAVDRPMTKHEIKQYRAHIAEAIYDFSTPGCTIQY